MYAPMRQRLFGDLCRERLPDGYQVVPEPGICLDLLLEALLGVEHRRVVFAAKQLTNTR